MTSDQDGRADYATWCTLSAVGGAAIGILLMYAARLIGFWDVEHRAADRVTARVLFGPVVVASTTLGGLLGAIVCSLRRQSRRQK